MSLNNHSSGMQSSEMKRRRVGIACVKCRDLKAKCDGRQPVCSRCEGYGFECYWPTTTRRRRSAKPERAAAAGSETQPRQQSPLAPQAVRPIDGRLTYLRAAESYETLIATIRAKLDAPHQAAVDSRLREIRAFVSHEPQEPTGISPAQQHVTIAPSPTYVGKASDIHFIHSVNRCVGACDLLSEDVPIQNYSQTHISESPVALRDPPLLPSKEEASLFLQVYLSTIHIAYPFLPRSALLEAFERFQSGNLHQPELRPWLPIFNFIFAIGSYYMLFPQGKSSNNRVHFRYYEQGLYYSQELSAESSLLGVCALLTQCFFLLAVCLTDRCWNVLGFAIRMGQSIGLHVESSSGLGSCSSWTMNRAHWRRTWYSMYVLDRLLALQLGRPMAIHEEDFEVDLPSRNDMSPFVAPDYEDAASSNTTQHTGMMDYFLGVIRFSHVLGSVIRALYRPSQVDSSPEQMLHNASELDHRLMEWKGSLPRHLRFDLGHTFEKSISFKRQRNMLAVKFHHLRALIYRSFLCLPLLQMNNQSFLDLLVRDKERISEAEWICIHEAQQTAQLLHNVADERSLVHDFPWWQMISCLICASSILFVAESFHSSSSPSSKTSAQNLRDDAETCLKVFEALSANSAAAQKAADILQGLSRMYRATGKGKVYQTVLCYGFL
ncbi:hypothetical protein N7452_002030 [Penicillium brevicompactum]|uniref:Zn(2)-C6 fungal-type domain-containing protein n=1 Tax=Penicillium brevicompactum TaxID=5074 RepID=A0A9W9R3K1_PENBR|nr:hypothetical protein N7452_002030 [Penicillium brevicompactum]